MGIFTSILVSRILGPSDRGVYFMVAAVNFMLVNIGNLGIGNANSYLLAKKKYSLSEVNANSLIMAVILGIAITLVYVMFHNPLNTYVLKGIDHRYVLVAILLVPFTLYSQFWSAMLVGLNQIILLNKFNIIFSMCNVVLTILVLVILKLGITGMILLMILTAIISAVVRLFIIKRQTSIKFLFKLRLFKEALSFALRGHIGSMFGVIWNKLDFFIVNSYIGIASVGQYSLSRGIAEKVNFISTPLMTAINPRITGDAREDSKRLTMQATRHTIFIMVLIIIAGLISAKWLIPFLYGEEYYPAVKPFMLVIIGTAVLRIGLFVSHYILGQLGKPEWNSALALIAPTIAIPLAFILIPKIGIIGAAISFTAACIIDVFASFVVFAKITKCKLRDTLIIKLSDFKVYHNLVLQVKSLLLDLPRHNSSIIVH